MALYTPSLFVSVGFDPTGLIRHRLLRESRSVIALHPPLKTALNALAPIERLPPEMLAYCFYLLRLEEFHMDIIDDDDTAGQIKWLVSVTHICRRWRSIALGSKKLWRVINLSIGRPWVDEMLSRSGSSLLHIWQIPLLTQNLPIICDIVSQHFSRIQELTFSAELDTIEKVGLVLSSKPALNLKRLALEILQPDEEDPAEFLVLYPDILFGNPGSTPRHLNLAGIILMPHPNTFQHLSTLILASVSTEKWEIPFLTLLNDTYLGKVIELNPALLLDVLSCMPLLQDLSLLNYLPWFPAAYLPGQNIRDVVHLSHLVNLVIHDELQRCGRFLQCITTPIATHRYLYCVYALPPYRNYMTVDEEEAHFTLVMPPNNAQCPIQTLDIQLDCFEHEPVGVPSSYFTTVCLMTSTSPSSIAATEGLIRFPTGGPDNKVTLRCMSDDSDGRSMLRKAMKTLNATSVTTLRVQVNERTAIDSFDSSLSLLNSGWWLEIFRGLCRLRYVMVFGEFAEALLEALEDMPVPANDIDSDPDSSLPKTPDTWFCHPNLTHLILVGIDFDTLHGDDYTSYDALLSMLDARRNTSSATALQWMSIANCDNVWRSHIERLRELVPVVVWDEDDEYDFDVDHLD